MKLFKIFWPILFIIFIWFAFSSPYFLQNKVPFPSKYLVNFFSPWVSYPGFSSPVKNNAMPDVISQIYPWKTFTIDSLKQFQVSIWNPYSFSGTPHLANYQSAVFSPFNLLFFLIPFIDAWSIAVLAQSLLAGVFMFYFLKSLKLSEKASLLGSISFMFSGFITTWMAYATLAFAILFLPLSLFAIEKYFQAKSVKFLILLSISIPLSFFSGHFQISLYFLIFVVSYLVFKLYQTKDLSSFTLSLSFVFFGILLSLPQLLPSVELYTQSLRSAIFQRLEAIPIGYLPTFIAPDFFGNPVTRNDWFGHYAEWNAFIGVIPILLGFYALTKKSKEIFFFGLMALIAILLSFQTPFLDLLIFLKVPVLSTSAASRMIVLFSFSMAVLSAFGFEKLFIDLKNKKFKHIFVFLSFFAAVFAVLWTVVILKLFMPADKIVIARQNLILPSALFFAFVLLTISVIFLASRVKKSKFPYIILASYFLILITTFDMLRFANKWMPFDPKNLAYPEVSISKAFNRISGFERVLGNLGGEATIYYKLPTLGGYDAVYIKRYGEFIASLQTGGLTQSARSVVSFPLNGLYTEKAINLLGVKYIINKKSDGRASWNFPYWNYPIGTFSLIYEDEFYEIFENKNAYPRAFLTSEFIVEKNPQKIISKIFSPETDLKNTIIIEENLNQKLDITEGLAKITSYKPNKVEIKITSNGNSMLFLSDTFYPGWKAFVDGQERKIYRSDYAFRSVFVPKGKHKVEFIYKPLSFGIGMLGFAIGLILIATFSILRRRLSFLPKLKLR